MLLALVVSGCDALPSIRGNTADDVGVPLVCGPGRKQPPCADGVEQGVRYRFDLLTHCGIEWAYFDGRYWTPKPKVFPPSDWANIEAGTMALKRSGVALFEATKGGGARFVPAPDTYRPAPCA